MRKQTRPPAGPPAGHEVVRTLYGWRASSYELQLAPYEFIRRMAVQHLQLRPGDCVLDLGCGTGMSLPMLRDAVGAAGRVVGVDLSPDMLAVARERVRRERWANVELHCAAVEEATPMRHCSISPMTSCRAHGRSTMCCDTCGQEPAWWSRA